MSDVLKKILKDAREARDLDQRFLAIFDLDSTLFDTKERQRKILVQFAEDSETVARWPAEAARLQTIQFETSDYGISEPLERIGFSLESDRKFLDEVRSYWDLWFFHNAFLKYDPPLPGAVEFVRALESLDADIIYLTARDVPRMLEGTRESLRKTGFPLDEDHVQLYLKEDDSIEDHVYKTEIIEKVARRYHRVWFFENEPTILNSVSRECPAVNLVFLDTCQSGREALHEELDTIPHYDVDLEELREFFPSRSPRH